MTAEDRAWVVAEWEASGQSAADFAKAMGIAMHTLYGWRRQIRTHANVSERAQDASPSTVPKCVPATFAEVVVRPPAVTTPPTDLDSEPARLEIAIGDTVIRVGRDFDDHQLRRVVNILRATA